MSGLIPIDGKGQPDALAEALRNLKKNVELMVEYQDVLARIQRAKFLALVKSGFTDAQALELCK